MNETIRENITDISNTGLAWELIQNLKVSSFEYKKIVNTPATEERFDEVTNQIIPAQPETYIPYPEGIQVMIVPSVLESMYPEGITTGSDGTKYYRAELVTAFLVQALKDLHKELSDRISTLEAKVK